MMLDEEVLNEAASAYGRDEEKNIEIVRYLREKGVPWSVATTNVRSMILKNAMKIVASSRWSSFHHNALGNRENW